jgi:hypothetical protein
MASDLSTDPFFRRAHEACEEAYRLLWWRNDAQR